MRRAATLAMLVACAVAAAGVAQARGHGFHHPRAHGFQAPRSHGGAARGFAVGRPRAAVAKGPTEGRHRRSGAEIKELGPSTFHPVKRYKGFSYLEHEKHPEKDD